MTNKRFITVLAVGIVVVTMLLAALLGHPALVALIMIANELVMRNWRRVRDDELLTVEITFDEAQSAQALQEKAAASDQAPPGDGDPIPPAA